MVAPAPAPCSVSATDVVASLLPPAADEAAAAANAEAAAAATAALGLLRRHYGELRGAVQDDVLQASLAATITMINSPVSLEQQLSAAQNGSEQPSRWSEPL